ncbi:MAG TPA: heme NO-binding domain-containing protein [Candidatus Binatia bacterium]|nr:heme NO-binding domain-containing protein [Candidatus Binatia bacterium]
MRGIVLTEFVDFADQAFAGAGSRLVPQPANGRGLSPVATYPEDRLRGLVRDLSAIAGRSEDEVLRHFGTHLFHRFAAIYPVFFEGARDSIAFLARVHEHVHGDLRRFHPDAELPELHCARLAEKHLVLEYRSPRPFADLAEGLVTGCVDYFGDDLEVAREDLPGPPGCAARFTLRGRADAQ